MFYVGVTNNELKCYQALLNSGKHIITDCLMTTGVFLQRPLDTVGGSCDNNICPSDASACRCSKEGAKIMFRIIQRSSNSLVSFNRVVLVSVPICGFSCPKNEHLPYVTKRCFTLIFLYLEKLEELVFVEHRL